MRVTETMLYRRALAGIENAQRRYHKAALEVSSGRRLNGIGDDPASTNLAINQVQTIRRLQAISRTVERAGDELSFSESVMGRVGEAVVRAREIGMQMVNSNYSQEDRIVVTAEINGLFGSIISNLNMDYAGRYLFGGHVDNMRPFADNGDYLGDDQVRQIEVAPGITSPFSIRADIAVKGAEGGVDLFQVLNELTDSLENDDSNGIRACLESLDTVLDQITRERTKAGAYLMSLDSSAELSRYAGVEAQLGHGKLVDADIFDAASRLALAQRALEASVSSAAQSFHISLLKKIG